MKKRILFILPTTGQPRYAKRIDSLKKLGFNVEALSFRRKYHKGRIPDCNISYLSNVESENYLMRIFTLIKDLPKIRKKSHEFDLVYAFGTDMGYLSILSVFLQKKPVVCEIADIMPIQQKKTISGIFIRTLDKIFFSKVNLLVFTSEHFINYFTEFLKMKPPFITLENKMDIISIKPIHKNLNDIITIGYFGLIRCQKSISILKSLAKEYPDRFKVLIAGVTDHTVELNNLPKNVKLIGEYKSPQDLAKIYGKVDIVWNVLFDRNMKWAMTNRFYESLYFQKPYIVNDCSVNIIPNKNCGLKISINDDFNKIIGSISKIKNNDIINWTSSVKNVNSDVYQYTKNDYMKLNDQILKLM